MMFSLQVCSHTQCCFFCHPSLQRPKQRSGLSWTRCCCSSTAIGIWKKAVLWEAIETVQAETEAECHSRGNREKGGSDCVRLRDHVIWPLSNDISIEWFLLSVNYVCKTVQSKYAKKNIVCACVYLYTQDHTWKGAEEDY